jgi:hypothetical protein
MTMRGIKNLVCGAASLALLLGVPAAVGAGKPDKGDKPGHPGKGDPKTQACVVTGDATASECTVGIDPKSFGPLTMEVAAGTALASTFAALGGAGPYDGLGRVLKRQGFFDFTLPDTGCRPLSSDDVMGPHLADDNVCRYLLQVRYGVYNRKADTVDFVASQAWLLDTWLAENQLISDVGSTATLKFQFE